MCSIDTTWAVPKVLLPGAIPGQRKEERKMAANTGKGYRKGAVTGRTQFERPDGLYQKRDERTGEFLEVKQSPGKFKGVALEPDGRDTDNA